MLTLQWPSKAAYRSRIFGSHDFAVAVEVLDLNEKPVGTATFDDGQINLQPPANGIRRTASLTLFDPEGALDFATSAAWSGTSLWANRLVRVTHTVAVPPYPGAPETAWRDVDCVCFVGVPRAMSRDGAEVDVELDDKAALANRGSMPYTVHKGHNAVDAIKKIMTDRTGEFRFRFPTSPRRLSRPYSVGWDDTASPFAVASKIARRELGMQLLYAADGALLLRKKPTTSSLRVPYLTAPAVGDVDFSGMDNRVQVTGKAKESKVGSGKNKQTIKTQPQAIAQVPSRDLDSPASLARKGVPRYLPLLVADDSLTTLAQVKAAAVEKLTAADGPAVTRQTSCVPFFHADADDIVTLEVKGDDTAMRLVTCSIPLGVGGDMTIGAQARVRKPKRVKSHVRRLRWHQVTVGTKKHHHSVWRRG